MRRLLERRPSPAMVVAVFALVFAMVGSAVAGTDGLSEKITKSKVKKIAKKQANKVASAAAEPVERRGGAKVSMGTELSPNVGFQFSLVRRAGWSSVISRCLDRRSSFLGGARAVSAPAAGW